MRQKIVAWIRKKVKEAKVKGVVIGISGGVDSALTAALCSRALGKNKVLGLILPCESQTQDIIDSRLIIKKLGIKVKVVDLYPIYKIYKKILPRANKICYGNLKARIRMSVLYYFANKYNYLVCGTSNKSESLMGYFTKYGDGAADILPIGNLFKKQVRELAKSLNLPKRIINKPPSAGLWLGQTDEAELGITYEQIDNIIGRLIKRKKQIYPMSLVNRLKSRMRASEHKRQPSAICKI